MVRQSAVQLVSLANDHFSRGPQTSHREDALHAIKALGATAAWDVPTGALRHIGSWLNWPGWLVDGTSLQENCPLPDRISVADDVMIIANVLDHADQAYLLDQVIERSRPLVSSRTANVFMSAPTFGEMLEFIKDTLNIRNPHFSLKIDAGRDFHTISVESNFIRGGAYGFLSFYCLIFIYRTISSTISSISSEFWLETTYCIRELGKFDRRLGDCRLQFGAQANRLHYPAEWAASPNIEFDPALWLLAQEERRSTGMSRYNAEIIDRIRGMVANVLTKQGRVPRLKQVATELGLSSRTIMRALAGNGTSFHEIVEDYRRRRAAQLINDRSLDLAAIATTLGFTDQSSFGRSFRKWFGASPGQLRKSGVQDLSAGR